MSADPAAAATGAVARASSLATPPAYSPLGDLFSNASDFAAGQIMGRAAAGERNSSTPYSPVSGRGSSKVVHG